MAFFKYHKIVVQSWLVSGRMSYKKETLSMDVILCNCGHVSNTTYLGRRSSKSISERSTRST